MSRLLRVKMAVAGVLGQVCMVCGAPGHWTWQPRGERVGSPLQVGHPKGRRWVIRRLNTTDRWARYLKEAIAGKVRAECGPCNRKHGGGLRYARVDKMRQGRRKLP